MGSGGRDRQRGELFQTARLGERRSGCGTGAGSGAGPENGFKTNYGISQLTAAGLTPTQPLGNHQQASLLRLDIGTGYQYWYGLPNFYTITRYNHSTHYAMAVWQLGLAVSQARGRNFRYSPRHGEFHFAAFPAVDAVTFFRQSNIVAL